MDTLSFIEIEATAREIKAGRMAPGWAEGERRRQRRARQNMSDFVLYTKPDYQMNWHHQLLCDHLDRLSSGEIKNLMVFMPPQHGKSQLVSRHFPAFALGQNPNLKIIAASYAAELIQGMNRDVQRLIDTPEYGELFPNTRINQPNIRTVTRSYLRNNDIFEIIGHRGQYRCAGVGGGLTGFPADLGIIDDPYKDYKEATSETVRNAVWEWYTSVFLSRTHVNTRKLITLTRWHQDDLAARLLALEAEKWTILTLPAVCDDPDAPNETRQKGEALWPERFPVETLEERKLLHPHQFNALYQQRPTARDGNFFKLARLETVEARPAGLKLWRGWDFGSTTDGDYSAGVLMGKSSDGIYYVCDVKRGQWVPDDRNAEMKAAASSDGRSTKIRIPQDPGQAGIDQVQSMAKMLAGYSVKAERVSGDKETRADGFAAQVNVGNVRLVRGDWNKPFRDELEGFPLGANDDQVDAAADAFNELALGNVFKQDKFVR